MEVKLQQLAKRYNREWLFRSLDYTFATGQAYAITGHNGSGKSTLLQLIAGMMPPTKGSVTYSVNNQTVEAEQIFRHLTLAAPYLELIEGFTLKELLQFHFKFKPIVQGLSLRDVVQRMYLEAALNKVVGNFSSGMKQRLKLGLAFFSDCPLLLLDEPTSNLDQQGSQWYLEHVQQLVGKRTIVICSNQTAEYPFCNYVVSVPDYKN